MNEKKLGNSKIYSFFDWVWRLMVLNFLTLVFSLGIITIMPAICAAFKSIKDTKENYNSKIVVPYIKNFVYLFRDTVWFSVMLLFVILVSGYAYLFVDGVLGAVAGSSEPMDQRIEIIAMIAIVIIGLGIFIVTLAFMQIPMIINYFYYGYMDNIKLSFYMAFKYFITTMIELVVFGLSAWLLYMAILNNYHLIPMWLFFGISIPLYVTYVVSRRFYTYVSGQTEDDEEDIDYQNKTVNRETYEDSNKTIGKEK